MSSQNGSAEQNQCISSSDHYSHFVGGAIVLRLNNSIWNAFCKSDKAEYHVLVTIFLMNEYFLFFISPEYFCHWTSLKNQENW